MTFNSKKGTLYVRGISIANIKFLRIITKEKGFVRVYEYLDSLLDRQRLTWENRRKQNKESLTIKRRAK